MHVPYKGIPESLTDTIAGRVQFTMAPIASSVSLIRDGRCARSPCRRKNARRICPTCRPSPKRGLPNFEWDSWGGILAPAKTPRAVVNKLNREIVKILGMPDIIERLRALGADPNPSTPAEMDAFVAKQLKLAMQIAKKAGIEPQ